MSDSAYCLRPGQARALVTQVAAGEYGDDVAGLIAHWRVGGRSLLAVLGVLVQLGAWRPGGWSGYFAVLERRTGLGERQVRRAMKCARALGLVVGAPLEPYQDEHGRWQRDAGAYRLALPRWISARWWRERPGPPTGHRRPESRAVTTNATPRDQAGPDPAPVDERPRGPAPPLPGDYLAARERLFGTIPP